MHTTALATEYTVAFYTRAVIQTKSHQTRQKLY